MGRTYAITFTDVAVTAAQDLFGVLPATQKPIKIKELTISQGSDVGDAAEEILQVTIRRGNTTVGSGGSAATPVPLNTNAGAAGATARVNDTTAASAGTAVTLRSEKFNIRSGYQMVFPDGQEPSSQNAEYLCVGISAPADSLTMSGTLIIEEVN